MDAEELLLFASGILSFGDFFFNTKLLSSPS